MIKTNPLNKPPDTDFETATPILSYRPLFFRVYYLSCFARLCLRTATRSIFAGRYGGEEFLLVFPNSAIDDSAHVLERLRINIESLVVECTHGLVTISGAIVIHKQGETLSQLISRADRLLYRAKQNGQNHISVTDEIVEDSDKESAL